MKAPCLLLAVIVGVAPVAVGQELPRTEPEAVGMSTARLERLGHALRTEIEEGRLPGAVVAIARRGRIVYHEAFGRVKPAAEAPMTKDAIFSVASMTKPLATVAALMLIEDGRLLLSDPIGKYLPQLDAMPVAVMSPDGQSILGTIAAHRKPTIQDLMRHTAGVTYGSRGTKT
jgi:CubicO group peptidase (beta-lactamase class C family)